MRGLLISKLYNCKEENALYSENMLTNSEKLRQSAYGHHARGALWDAAADCYRGIIVSPGSAWPYVLLGKCYLKMGRQREGVAMLERALQLMPAFSSDGAERVRDMLTEAKLSCH